MTKSSTEFDPDDDDDDLEDREVPDEFDQDINDDPETTPCPYCGALISEDAEVCPKCHSFLSAEDLPPQTGHARWVLWAAVAILISMVLGVLGIRHLL